MNWKIWYTLPNGKSFAFVARSMTSSLGLMAARQFYPERLPSPEPTAGNAHRLLDHTIGTTLPSGCVVVVRDPVERFASLLGRWKSLETNDAIAMVRWGLGKGSDETINRDVLEAATLLMMHHFCGAATFAQQDSTLIKFPNISAAATELGLTGEAVHINQSESHRQLTSEQQSKVATIYADDLALWQSLQP